MRGVRLLCLIGFCTLPLVRLVAQREYEVLDTVTIPQIFFVGDRVEMRLRFDYNGSGRLQAPSSPRDPNWATIDEIRLASSGEYYSLRIFFTPYHPGTQSFPPIDLGPIELTGIGAYVTPILNPDSNELAPLRNQVLLPNTLALIFAIVAGLIALPFFTIVSARWLRGQTLLQRYRRTRPYRHIQKTFKYLALRGEQIDARNFYIRLLDDFRLYLSQRTSRDWLAATTSELLAYLRRIDSDRERVRGIAVLFRNGDLVKFARQNVPPAMRKRHLERMQRFVIGMETEIDLRG